MNAILADTRFEKSLILWETGKLKLNPNLREKIILYFLPTVRSIAMRIAHRLPLQIQAEDLISTGVLGLIDAINKFKPAYNTRFKTYADNRIRGSILDELRSLDWAPRSVRKNTREMEQAMFELEKKLNRPPSEEELAKQMKISIKEVHRILGDASSVNLFSLDEVRSQDDKPVSLKDIVSEKGEFGRGPLQILSIKEVKSIIKETIATLPKTEKIVLSLYYFEEITMKEIGKALNITESRVCQLHGKAVLRLKVKLSHLKD